MALDPGVLAELESIVGREHVRHREGEVAPYARDATPLFSSQPDAVVFPARTEEVAAVLRLATAQRVPVVPRGAGSNLCAATVPLQGGILLVLTRMEEPAPPPGFLARAHEYADAAEIPRLLFLRTEKLG